MGVRLIELPELAVGGGRPRVGSSEVGRPGRALAQRRHRVSVAPQNVVGVSQDLLPKPARDAEPGGKKEVLTLLRTTVLAPLLGLPGLAVPVGSHGKLRTGVQIMAMRNREDLCLDAGEVIEDAEGVVMPIDPARA